MAAHGQRLSGKFKTSQQIFPLEVRKFAQYLLDSVAPREIFQHYLNRIAHTADTWFPMADLGIDGDAANRGVQRGACRGAHGCTLSLERDDNKLLWMDRSNHLVGDIELVVGVLDGGAIGVFCRGIRMLKIAYHPSIEPKLEISARGFHRRTSLS
jgi:hypothetical protein